MTTAPETHRPETLASYAGKTVLVTGASGFIGGNLLRALAAAPCRILAQSRCPAQMPDGVRAAVISVTGDLSHPEVMAAALSEPVDVVFHLAAQTSSNRSEEAPLEDLQLNCEMTLALLEGLRRQGGRPAVLLASSATTVGLTPPEPVNESIQERPITIYDIHKLTAEHYIRHFSEAGFIKGASLRLANVYGAGAVSMAADRGVLNNVITRALKGEPPFVFTPGTWLRDYVHISDVVEAFLATGANAERLDGRAYFVGSGVGTSVKDAFALALDRVAARTGRRVRLAFRDPPAELGAIEFRTFVADTTALTRATGWSATCALPDGIDRTIELFLAGKA